MLVQKDTQQPQFLLLEMRNINKKKYLPLSQAILQTKIIKLIFKFPVYTGILIHISYDLDLCSI
jgi:hypothetical protein